MQDWKAAAGIHVDSRSLANASYCTLLSFRSISVRVSSLLEWIPGSAAWTDDDEEDARKSCGTRFYTRSSMHVKHSSCRRCEARPNRGVVRTVVSAELAEFLLYVEKKLPERCR